MLPIPKNRDRCQKVQVMESEKTLTSPLRRSRRLQEQLPQLCPGHTTPINGAWVQISRNMFQSQIKKLKKALASLKREQTPAAANKGGNKR